VGPAPGGVVGGAWAPPPPPRSAAARGGGGGDRHPCRARRSRRPGRSRAGPPRGSPPSVPGWRAARGARGLAGRGAGGMTSAVRANQDLDLRGELAARLALIGGKMALERFEGAQVFWKGDDSMVNKDDSGHP